MKWMVTKFLIGCLLLICALCFGNLDTTTFVSAIGIGAIGLGSVLDDKITALTTELTRNTSLKDSLLALIQSIPGMIQKAKDDALAAGATTAQLASLDALSTTLAANDTALSDAVTANTPAAGT